MILVGIDSWTKDASNADIKTKNVENEQMICEKWLNILSETVDEDVADETINSSNEDLTEPESELEQHQPDEPKIETEKPKHIEITINIINRCMKYISSKERAEQIIAIETICTGLKIIRHYENDMLPIVHLIWYSFAERLKETDPIILRRCLMMLDVLGHLAKDFICTKTSR